MHQGKTMVYISQGFLIPGKDRVFQQLSSNQPTRETCGLPIDLVLFLGKTHTNVEWTNDASRQNRPVAVGQQMQGDGRLSDPANAPNASGRHETGTGLDPSASFQNMRANPSDSQQTRDFSQWPDRSNTRNLFAGLDDAPIQNSPGADRGDLAVLPPMSFDEVLARRDAMADAMAQDAVIHEHLHPSLITPSIII